MKKVLKWIAIVLAAIIALILLLLLTLPLWLGPVAKPTAANILPRWTGTPVQLGHLSLNPYVGRFELGNLVVSNPAGYQEPIAISVSNIVFDVAVSTICDKYVHIEDIVVDDLFLCYVTGGAENVSNLQQIQYNLAGGKEQYEANMAKSEEAKKVAQAKADAEVQKELEREKTKLDRMTPEEREAYQQHLEAVAEARADAEKRYAIDHVLIRGLKLRYGMLTLPLPTLELHNLGGENGASFSEIHEEVWQAILKAISSTGDGIKQLSGLLNDSLKDGLKNLDGTLDKLGEHGDSANKKVSETVNAVKGLLGL